MKHEVFVTGSTGYIGRRLIEALIDRGHPVRAFCRAASVAHVRLGATAVVGDALVAESVAGALRPTETLVHLIGTPHPGPARSAEFLRVDLASVRAAVDAARHAATPHFVYVSVAHPAPVMKAYVAARAEGERTIASAGLTATVLRPWYVLGPGHRWPVTLMPLYGIASLLPALRPGARRLGLVTLRQMVAALVAAVEHPPPPGSMRILEVPAIRAAG